MNLFDFGLHAAPIFFAKSAALAEVIATLESLLKNFKQKNIEADNDEMAIWLLCLLHGWVHSDLVFPLISHSDWFLA